MDFVEGFLQSPFSILSKIREIKECRQMYYLR